jgi:hypothetical protein
MAGEQAVAMAGGEPMGMPDQAAMGVGVPPSSPLSMACQLAIGNDVRGRYFTSESTVLTAPDV